MKDIRKKVNKKINDNYNKRQKILTEIKKSLNMEFGKISNYKDEIIIAYQSLQNTKNNSNSHEKNNSNNNNILNKSSLTNGNNDDPSNVYRNQRKSSLFRIDIPNSIMGIPQFYYKNKEINYLTLSELVNLQKDMDYILEEIEKEMDKSLD